MTLLECFQKMDDVWFYLWNNPAKDKKEAYYDLGLARDRNDCPCCEYAYQQANNCLRETCKFCPLKDFWPIGGCAAEGSPYVVWLDSDDLEIRAGAAAEICCTANRKFFDIRDE